MTSTFLKWGFQGRRGCSTICSRVLLRCKCLQTDLGESGPALALIRNNCVLSCLLCPAQKSIRTPPHATSDDPLVSRIEATPPLLPTLSSLPVKSASQSVSQPDAGVCAQCRFVVFPRSYSPVQCKSPIT